MEAKEFIERQMCDDARIFKAIQDAKKNDPSFTDRGMLGVFPPRYPQVKVRKIWFDAMTLGMQEGLRMASVEGQRIELTNNVTNLRHKEFVDKFYKLAEEYGCAIQYHSTYGMIVIDQR